MRPLLLSTSGVPWCISGYRTKDETCLLPDDSPKGSFRHSSCLHGARNNISQVLTVWMCTPAVLRARARAFMCSRLCAHTEFSSAEDGQVEVLLSLLLSAHAFCIHFNILTFFSACRAECACARSLPFHDFQINNIPDLTPTM